MSFSIYYKNGVYYERIIPKEFVGKGVLIEFSSREIEEMNSAQFKAYRYSFEDKNFKNLSLSQYNDFGQTLYVLASHFIENHYFTMKGRNFIYDFNIFKRDKIVLQFSVSKNCSEEERKEIKCEFIDIFTAALKIHEIHGSENFIGKSYEYQYIMKDFAEAINLEYVKKETLDPTLLKFLEKHQYELRLIV